MVTLKEVLSDAQRRRIAIGHFNVSDLVGLKAVTGAAEILNVPVLVGTSEGERNFLGAHKIRGRSILTPRGDADIDRQNSSRLRCSP
jgi:fructose/tagatose bisphosphate aldolase